jgi:DNA-binding transcriptional MerR regulator
MGLRTSRIGQLAIFAPPLANTMSLPLSRPALRSPLAPAATARPAGLTAPPIGGSVGSDGSGVTERYLTLKDMTRGGGCTPRTVRYYERQGLLRAARSAGGHRLFAAVELERLNFVVALREAGWALEEIVEILGAREAAPDARTAAERLGGLLGAQIERLEKKLAVLERLREDLRGTHQALQVCGECTKMQDEVACEVCDRLPGLGLLPRGFRLTWRARELEGPPFDEHAADGFDDTESSASS